jgi:hypothetical protein
MEFNEITKLEREIAFVLKEEYSFYQSLYILIDKQKDMIKYEKDEKLLDLFTEIERCHQRILQSEKKISELREKNQKLFKIAAASPEIKKLVTSIITMVKKNVSLVNENENYLKSRHQRLKSELRELQNSSKILKYIKDAEPAPQFINDKK